jgi:transcriptional regulator with PAS, ATPase and Fis domain
MITENVLFAKKDKKAYQFSELLLSAMLDNKHQGVIVIDGRGKVIYHSRCLDCVFNQPSGNVFKKHFLDVCLHPAFRRLFEVLQTGAPVYQKQEHIEEREVMVDFLPVADQENILGAVARVIFMNKQPGGRKKTAGGEINHPEDKQESAGLSSYRFTIDQIIGASPQMIDLKETINKVSPRNSNILITGESGTGKELFAHAIQSASLRRYGPFIKINCAAIPDSLMESELFGYEEGAFTGGKKGGQKGKLELANGGTVFFDEIGELSLPLQAKLLRFLQEREIHKLGCDSMVTVDVRVIAATNVHLEQYVKYKKFREDLYYRLNVVNLIIPPLRERREDIPELVRHSIEKFNRIFNLKVTGIDQEVLKIFMRYPWPGNIRELENVIERAFNVIEGDTIQLAHLPARLAGIREHHKNYAEKIQHNGTSGIEEGLTLADIMNETERMIIKKAIALSEGNKSKAAKILGVTRPCLYKKMIKHDLLQE